MKYLVLCSTFIGAYAGAITSDEIFSGFKEQYCDQSFSINKANCNESKSFGDLTAKIRSTCPDMGRHAEDASKRGLSTDNPAFIAMSQCSREEERAVDLTKAFSAGAKLADQRCVAPDSGGNRTGNSHAGR